MALAVSAPVRKQLSPKLQAVIWIWACIDFLSIISILPTPIVTALKPAAVYGPAYATINEDLLIIQGGGVYQNATFTANGSQFMALDLTRPSCDVSDLPWIPVNITSSEPLPLRLVTYYHSMTVSLDRHTATIWDSAFHGSVTEYIRYTGAWSTPHVPVELWRWRSGKQLKDAVDSITGKIYIPLGDRRMNMMAYDPAHPDPSAATLDTRPRAVRTAAAAEPNATAPAGAGTTMGVTMSTAMRKGATGYSFVWSTYRLVLALVSASYFARKKPHLLRQLICWGEEPHEQHRSAGFFSRTPGLEPPANYLPAVVINNNNNNYNNNNENNNSNSNDNEDRLAVSPRQPHVSVVMFSPVDATAESSAPIKPKYPVNSTHTYMNQMRRAHREQNGGESVSKPTQGANRDNSTIQQSGLKGHTTTTCTKSAGKVLATVGTTATATTMASITHCPSYPQGNNTIINTPTCSQQKRDIASAAAVTVPIARNPRASDGAASEPGLGSGSDASARSNITTPAISIPATSCPATIPHPLQEDGDPTAKSGTE